MDPPHGVVCVVEQTRPLMTHARRALPRKCVQWIAGTLGVFAVLFSSLVHAQWAQVSSPDGRLVVTIDQLDLGATVTRYPAGNHVYYNATLDGIPVLEWSPLGIVLSDRAFDSNLTLVASNTSAVSDNYVLVSGKRRSTGYTANALSMTVDNPAGDRSTWEVRVFNDGLAFRYVIDGTEVVNVISEQSGYRLPSGAIGYLAPAQAPGTYEPSYEVPYIPQAAGTSLSAEGTFFPALFTLASGNTHVLLHEAGLDETYAASRLGADASDNVYQLRFPAAGEGDVANATQPQVTLPLVTPWRMAAIGNLEAIVETDLVTHLSAPLDAVFNGDTAWIEPGKSAWSWWSQGTGTPALQREYVDFAAEQGWEYIVVDEGWTQWAAGELVSLVQYAAASNVRVFVWYNSGGSHNTIALQPRDRLNTPAQMQAEFLQLAQWGVAGIKVDFFRSDKQARIAQYREILSIAAQNSLLVNLHGATVPRGWQRQFPNLMTTEAVLGAEYYKWAAGPSAMDNVRLAFTRNVVGSMDYTPLTFAAALAQQNISYAHQLALSGLFESGLQVFADQADSDPLAGYRAVFTSAPFVADYLSELPTVWDETLLVEGSPASHAVIARRSGERWYVSGINGQAVARSVAINLGTFANNFYSAQLIEQGASPDALQSTLSDLNYNSTVNVTMAPQGGFVLVLKPKNELSPWKDAPWDGNWRTTWMGQLNDNFYPLVLHREHDWLFAFNNDPDAMWIWSASDGWWWVSQTSYPQIYDATSGHLLFYAEGTDNPRWFYDSDLGQWISRP